MTITGEVTKIFDIQEGITKMGAKWAKQDVLITQNNDYNAEVIVIVIYEKENKGISFCY